MRLIVILLWIVCSAVYAQRKDSLHHRDFKVVKIVAAPVVLISLGLYNKSSGAPINRFDIKNWRDENYPNFSNRLDDAIQFIPIGLVYGFDLINVKAKNDMINRSLLLLKTELLMNGVVQLIKRTTKVRRPNGWNEHSFPSGHTAQAFAAATFMHKELGHHSIWISIGAYGMATSVGLLRVMNDKHWSSDVLVGAGIGILSTNLVYLTHRYKWGKRPDVVLLPTYMDGPGLYLSLRLK